MPTLNYRNEDRVPLTGFPLRLDVNSVDDYTLVQLAQSKRATTM
jgi:hypothetical protein